MAKAHKGEQNIICIYIYVHMSLSLFLYIYAYIYIYYTHIVVIFLDLFSNCWSLIVGFPGVWGGLGVFRKLREACGNNVHHFSGAPRI